jgi:hypothetical protein
MHIARRHLFPALLVLAAFPLGASATGCSGSTTSVTGDGGSVDLDAQAGDAASTTAADANADAGDADGPVLAALGPCPTTGRGAITPVGACYTLTPQQVGASPDGENAAVPQYALEPAAVAKGALVVQLNGSGGSPAGQVAGPVRNIYNAYAAAGYHVVGLSYRSDKAIGLLCAGNDACFEPTRRSLVLGMLTLGAGTDLATLRFDEGIVYRLQALLAALAAEKPGAGWDQFLKPGADAASRVAWDKIVASGHSQGGGHAAMLGKLFALRGVVQLSSTCDSVQGTPASWTSAAGYWATSPHDKFVGFAAPTTFGPGGAPTGGDTTCGFHAAVWQNLGMAAANMHDDAALCGATGDTHGASIGCVDNYPRWGTLLP